MARKGINPLKIGVPTLPAVPYTGTPEELQRWIHQMHVELELYFNKMKNTLVDHRGFLFVDTQVVDDGFVVQPVAHFIDIYPEDHVTNKISDPITAIAAGVPAQHLILTNTTGGTITLIHGAQTFFVAGVDLVLQPLNSVSLRWDDVSKVWVQFIML